MTIQQGLNMVGILKGVRTEISGQYTNEYLGIAITSNDGYGGTREQLEEIPLFGDSGSKIKTKVPDLIGELVSVSFFERALKSERTQNAYMRRSLHANSDLVAL